MDFNAIVTLIQNTGVTIVVIGYFIFRDYQFMNTLQETLTTLTQTVDNLKEWIKEKQ